MSVSYNNQDEVAEISVQLADGSMQPVHPLWLRERSTAADMLDARTEQRLYNPSDLDPAVTLRSVEAVSPGWLRIRFSDGHSADFAISAIEAEAGLAPCDDGVPSPILWNGSLATLPAACWRAGLDDAAILGITEDFLRYGFVLLRDVPSEPGQVLKVARQFGFPRETNFGVLFDVRSVPDANDLAYTSLALEPHTDNPYRDPVPGIQLLHCLTNRTAGGLSTLVNGVAVAEALRVRDAHAFQILASTPVRFRYIDRDAELIAWAPMIDCTVTGVVRAVHVSARLDFVPLLSAPELDRFYRARRLFDALLKSAEFEIRFRLDDGDLVMFDNRRLLHGRTSFDPAEGLRHLQGCYIDSDGPQSLYRVLRRRLKGVTP
jgi:gamma-butyrobetaine dioxygenase